MSFEIYSDRVILIRKVELIAVDEMKQNSLSVKLHYTIPNLLPNAIILTDFIVLFSM
jgi:hypothetical protein